MTEELKTPTEWAAVQGVAIADPDGWRGGDAKSFDEPLSESEFNRRAAKSTINFRTRERFIPNVTRVQSVDPGMTYYGTFRGWDVDGAALVLWDGYDDEDSTFRYAIATSEKEQG